MTAFRLDDLTIPDSVLAREAAARAEALLSPAVVAHSVRTFLFASAAGLARKLRFDVEALYIASMLHDLGFGDTSPKERAFEVEGANAARNLLAERGDGRGQLVWDAIAMLTIAHLAAEREPEVLLLHLGSSADAFGARLDRFPEGFVAEVFAHYPRTALAAEFDAITTAIAERHPYSQLAAFRALGLRYLE